MLNLRRLEMIAILCVIVLISVSGCAPMKNLGQSLGGGGIEQVEGKYYVELKYYKESASKHHFNRKSPTQIIKDMADNVFMRSQPKYEQTRQRGRRGMVYYYCMDSPRFIRYIRMETVDPIKNIDVYVWEDETWKIVGKLKSAVAAQTRIDINRRTNAISVVQKTIKTGSKDRVTDFEVYVQKK